MLATAVESTTLATVTYDSPAQLLWLEFRNRAVYCYFDVPPSVHQGLMAAPSKGIYFNRNIRGRFPYRREAVGRHQQSALEYAPKLLP
jgi:hypothetical protein